MTPEQLELVTESFRRTFAGKTPVARAFYDRLFAEHPELRPLFPQKMAAQYEKFTDTLVFVVRHLARRATVLVSAEELGQRHRAYGVRPEHYAIVGQALLAAMAEVTPGGLSPAERAAWDAAYALVSDRMRAMTDATGG
ncbi:globin domain-containing protein [Roseivivax isoporae]|uniref:Globin domain-containing protein n=1 Tax=Roseivivax isoporae LMG 25204 TaxID=1449351 RepID=X7F9A6_9RHOB|nr:globin domain-containing protein [Roseivivax isoporae]ETX29308.1 hypothetical protein RISW2_01175 [Roseivivax isoporae LMG 25204]